MNHRKIQTFMSIVSSIINSIQAAFSNEAFNQIQREDYRKQLMDAITEASKDHIITAEEVVDIQGLVTQLDLSNSDLRNIRVLVMKDLCEHVLADGKITEDEMKLFEALSTQIEFKEGEENKLKEDFDKVKGIYENSLS